jgi:hypothetical protein
MSKVTFPIGTLMVAKDKKTITATKVGTNLWEGTAIQLADQEVYDGFNKENFFVSPKNVSGIERLAKKYATKFPDFVATLLQPPPLTRRGFFMRNIIS